MQTGGPTLAESCLSDETVLALRDGGLPYTLRAQLDEHLNGCAICRARVRARSGSGDSPLLTEVSRVGPNPLDADLPPGTIVDHYRVERQVGKGGMGEVYLASDTLLGRRVALKMVKPQLVVREKLRQQFLREARAMAKLSHPNIVTIHGVGEADGRPYVALEFVDGETMRDRARHTAFVFQEAAVIGAEVADALAAAHAAGVIHRDLKPTNIMLGRDGRTRVLDFGLAKMIGGESMGVSGEMSFGALTDSTLTVMGGTPMYMPPEQWKGTGTGWAADIWALGVILYEMCTGRRPYEREIECGDPVERMTQLCARVCSDDPVPIDDTGVPPVMHGIISACLAKEPGRRPSASEVASALWAISEAPLARRGGGHTRSQSEISALAPATFSQPAPAPRHGWLVLGAAAALVIGGAVAVAASLGLRDESRAASAAWSGLASLEVPREQTAPSPAEPVPVAPPTPVEEEPAPKAQKTGARPPAAPPTPAPSAAPRDPLSYR